MSPSSWSLPRVARPLELLRNPRGTSHLAYKTNQNKKNELFVEKTQCHRTCNMVQSPSTKDMLVVAHSYVSVHATVHLAHAKKTRFGNPLFQSLASIKSLILMATKINFQFIFWLQGSRLEHHIEILIL